MLQKQSVTSDTNICDEHSVLLSKDPANGETQLSKKGQSCKKSCLWLVCALVIAGLTIFAGYMIKWHFISQSVIKPSGKHYVAQFNDVGNEDDSDEDDYGKSGLPPIGAAAKQPGKAFPFAILAQIALKDITQTIDSVFGTNYFVNSNLGQSKNMIPYYITQDDCDYAINYFENIDYQLTLFKDFQYIRMNRPILECDEATEEDNNNNNNNNGGIITEDETMLNVISKIETFFYQNYKNELTNKEIYDISIIKYDSNGTTFTGLHAESHYIDGVLRNKIADFVGVVFLNDNFNGGYLQFIGPNAIKDIKPQIGNGILFGGGLEYAHRVTPVKNGDRYILRMIFNKKRE